MRAAIAVPLLLLLALPSSAQTADLSPPVVLDASAAFPVSSVSENAVASQRATVSNGGDSGPGSLRAAIEETNQLCGTRDVLCHIDFSFGEGIPALVEPLTALPALTACHVVMGEPNGPRAVISGRHVPAGDGLELRAPCETASLQMFGITIRDFPRDAIAMTTTRLLALTNVELLSNGARGVSATVPEAFVWLNDVVIGANGRSALALFDKGGAQIRNTWIGIGRDGSELGNGASGIYAAPRSSRIDIRDTIIANNSHFGLALGDGARPFIHWPTVTITRNILDVDWQLDGPTLNREDDDIPNTPRVLNARYDAATDSTRVTFAIDEPPQHTMDIQLWTSDRVTIFGTAHLDKLAGVKRITAGTPTSQPFTIEIRGDLRGLHVSAVQIRLTSIPTDAQMPEPGMVSMSEVSTAIRVE